MLAARLRPLADWLERERSRAPELELPDLLTRALERFAYPSHLRSLPDAHRRLANVAKLIDLARAWEASEGRDLPAFLEDAAFQQASAGGFLAGAEAIAEPDAPAPAGSGSGSGSGSGPAEPLDAIRLMTVHAAKGLEFDVVCVADLGRAPTAAMPDLLLDGPRIGLRLLDLQDASSQPTLEYEHLARERRHSQAAEEDRIAYVAMTRARERLLLSGAVDFAAWPRDRPGGPPVAWLAPALAPDVPVLCREHASHCRDRADLGGRDGGVRGGSFGVSPGPGESSRAGDDVSETGGPRARARPRMRPRAGPQFGESFHGRPAAHPCRDGAG